MSIHNIHNIYTNLVRAVFECVFLCSCKYVCVHTRGVSSSVCICSCLHFTVLIICHGSSLQLRCSFPRPRPTSSICWTSCDWSTVLLHRDPSAPAQLPHSTSVDRCRHSLLSNPATHFKEKRPTRRSAITYCASQNSAGWSLHLISVSIALSDSQSVAWHV